MKTIEQKHRIKAPIEKVWQALVNAKTIEKWSGKPAKMDDKEGTEFKLWGGDIHGKNIKVIKNMELVQDWFSGEWKNPSRVLFKLIDKGKETEMNLTQKNVPEEDAMDISRGWKDYYIGQMRSFLEKR
jgi:activator of HSP90 ATPase